MPLKNIKVNTEMQLSWSNMLLVHSTILTSIKNASSKMLHNLVNSYTIKTKFAFSLFLVLSHGIA